MKKKKVLLVFGNPATHSVKHGMFFFSKDEVRQSRHSMWGKLAKAELVEKVPPEVSTRQEEAEFRRKIILEGLRSEKYLVGMTTFYSYPTTAEEGVAGVEKLFAPILDEIKRQETKRILNYEFAKNAKFVFVQQSSYKAFLAHVPARENDTIFWPIRGRGSSGGDLGGKLDECFARAAVSLSFIKTQ